MSLFALILTLGFGHIAQCLFYFTSTALDRSLTIYRAALYTPCTFFTLLFVCRKPQLYTKVVTYTLYIYSSYVHVLSLAIIVPRIESYWLLLEGRLSDC